MKLNTLYKKAIEVEPDFSEAYSNLGAVYYLQKSTEKARACFEKSLSCTYGEREVGYEWTKILFLQRRLGCRNDQNSQVLAFVMIVMPRKKSLCTNAV
jgi:tetratricopeptide (TPR) repeat protein